MAKALTKADIAFELERWASATKKLAKLEEQQAAEIEPFAAEFEAKCKEITGKYSKQTDKLQADIDDRESRITGWLDTKEKTTAVDSKHAVAEVVHGTKQGNRVPNIPKLIALCKKKDVDIWEHVSILLGGLDKALGADEVTAISTRESKATKTVTVKLKD